MGPGEGTGQMEYDMPAHGGGRSRGQESRTHQYDVAYEVGTQLMQAPSDMATQVLMESYERVLDWGQRSEHRQGQSAFYKGLRPVFSQAQRMFQAKLGDGAHFRFWSDDWSDLGPLRDLWALRNSRDYGAAGLAQRMVPIAP